MVVIRKMWDAYDISLDSQWTLCWWIIEKPLIHWSTSVLAGINLCGCFKRHERDFQWTLQQKLNGARATQQSSIFPASIILLISLFLKLSLVCLMVTTTTSTPSRWVGFVLALVPTDDDDDDTGPREMADQSSMERGWRTSWSSVEWSFPLSK